MTYKVASKGETKGERRIKIILEAAEQLLIDSGYHNFSMRKVATKAGVSVGNLQYYFPSKDKLLAAVLDHVIQNYLDTFLQFRGRYTPKEQFIKIIKLNEPWGSSFIDNDEIIITEKSGKIKIVNIVYIR